MKSPMWMTRNTHCRILLRLNLRIVMRWSNDDALVVRFLATDIKDGICRVLEGGMSSAVLPISLGA